MTDEQYNDWKVEFHKEMREMEKRWQDKSLDIMKWSFGLPAAFIVLVLVILKLMESVN